MFLLEILWVSLMCFEMFVLEICFLHIWQGSFFRDSSSDGVLCTVCLCWVYSLKFLNSSFDRTPLPSTCKYFPQANDGHLGKMPCTEQRWRIRDVVFVYFLIQCSHSTSPIFWWIVFSWVLQTNLLVKILWQNLQVISVLVFGFWSIPLKSGRPGEETF